jgi:hypothetical protein
MSKVNKIATSLIFSDRYQKKKIVIQFSTKKNKQLKGYT